MTKEEIMHKAGSIVDGMISNNVPSEICNSYYQGFIECAKWADKMQIERVLEFIFEYFYEHPHVNGHICTDSFESLEELEEELIKAMEE